jgi:hypothetical protein
VRLLSLSPSKMPMRKALLLALALALSGPASAACAQRAAPLAAVPPADPIAASLATPATGLGGPALPVLAAPDDTVPRHRAVEHDDAYYRRLQIHRVGSYAMLPLFVGEYFLGERLIRDGDQAAGWVKPAHVATAAGLGVLFTSNTVTGVWNLAQSRHDPQGRARRTVHAVTMLAADAGFAAAGIAAGGARHDPDTHKQLAIGSMGLATAGTLLMWLWKV